jgi:hypothetical protein
MCEILIFKWFLLQKIQINFWKPGLEGKISWGHGNSWANGTDHTSLIYKFTMCVRLWRSSGPSQTGPDVNRRAEFSVPSLWAKLLEEIRLGHSSAERRPGIADVKNGVTGRVRSRLSENTHWGKLSGVTFWRVFFHLSVWQAGQGGRAKRPGKF